MKGILGEFAVVRPSNSEFWWLAHYGITFLDHDDNGLLLEFQKIYSASNAGERLVGINGGMFSFHGATISGSYKNEPDSSRMHILVKMYIRTLPSIAPFFPSICPERVGDSPAREAGHHD